MARRMDRRRHRTGTRLRPWCQLGMLSLVGCSLFQTHEPGSSWSQSTPPAPVVAAAETTGTSVPPVAPAATLNFPKVDPAVQQTDYLANGHEPAQVQQMAGLADSPNQISGGQSAAVEVQTLVPATTPQLQQRTKELPIVGKKLAKASQHHFLRWRFEVLPYPHPRLYHTEHAQLTITTGLLERLASEEVLACVLALEMAELLLQREREDQFFRASNPLPSTGPDDEFRERLLAHKEMEKMPAITPEALRQRAAELLQRAGYPNHKLTEVDEALFTWEQQGR